MTISIIDLLNSPTSDSTYFSEEEEEDVNEYLKSLSVYTIILYLTHDNEDKKENYILYCQEAVWGLKAYKERLGAIKNHATCRMTNGENTGFYLFAYRMSPMEGGYMDVLVNMHEFKEIKKTFLNGPLKDNEFLSKKGKHYATNGS